MKPRTCERALRDLTTFAALARAAIGCGCSVLCLFASLALCPGVLAQTQPAHASPAEVEARNTTMARALFEEGLRYVDSEQWEQAQDRFGRVLTLRYSAVAAYNYGLALARLGRGVVASSALRRLLTDVNLDVHVHEHASSLLREVEARFAWLNVRVHGECKGCEVYLNEQLWPWAAIGVFVPVDAGSYALRLRLNTNVLAEQRLAIAATERVSATLSSGHAAGPVLAHAPHAGPGDPMLAPTPRAVAERPGGSVLKSPWFWGAMGVMALGAAGTVVLASQ